jgi:predicted hydrocarbon binding protein
MVSVVFPKIEAGTVNIALYKDGGVGFLNGPDGIVRVSRSWGDVISSDAKEYNTDFISDWPFGSGSLSIYSETEFTLSIDVRDCIPIGWYVQEPKKYGYRT